MEMDVGCFSEIRTMIYWTVTFIDTVSCKTVANTHRKTDNTSSNSRRLSSRFNRPILLSSGGSVPSTCAQSSRGSSLLGPGSGVALVLGLEEGLQGNAGSRMLLSWPSLVGGRMSRSSSNAQRQWCFPGLVHGFCIRSSTRPMPIDNRHVLFIYFLSVIIKGHCQ
jgi:hypothetical protein